MAKKARSSKSKAQPQAPRPLLYKVVEFSNVDESSMEDTVNAWVQKGWTFDGVQFAMRESSKRPSMAFVFFTRPGTAKDEQRARRIAEPDTASTEGPTQPVPVSAWDRLAQLANEDDSD